ncbi:sensor histidine kinase [Caldanaerobius fijiensis]|uniref:hypothetical protein n=1 Tax=Caldanaerobius fijiensis TaxID=456330 RepID=UPI0009335B62|nr:hypothetical protein [Caldanaerobius fijiensis]
MILTEKNQDITGFNKLGLLGRYGSIKGDINGTESVVAYTTSYVTDWKYISVIPTSVILSKVDYIKNITIGLTAVLLIIGLILAYFFAYVNYDPIKQLLHWIKDHISITGNDKYGNEFEFIRLTLSNTYDESKKIKSELLRQKPILKANIMYRLLKGSIENRDIDELKDYLDISFDSDYFAVVIYQINHGGKLIKEGNAKEWVLTRFTVSKIIDEVADKYVNSFVVELDKDKLAEIVNFRVDDIDECKKELLDIIAFSKDFIERHYEILLSVGVGRIYKTSGVMSSSIFWNLEK